MTLDGSLRWFILWGSTTNFMRDARLTTNDEVTITSNITKGNLTSMNMLVSNPVDVSVSRWCQYVILCQEHEAVLPDSPHSHQISTLLDMDQPSLSSPILPFPIVQRHLCPFATGLTVHVPYPDHQHHAQAGWTAQKHAQLPGTVSGDDVWVFWSFRRIGRSFGFRVGEVWFQLVAKI